MTLFEIVGTQCAYWALHAVIAGSTNFAGGCIVQQ
jgi:hypothetical protein